VKRIIFLNRFFFPDHSATSQILSDLCFHLAQSGYDVEVITSQQRYEDSRARLPANENICGVTIHRVTTTQFGRSHLTGRLVDYVRIRWARRRMSSREMPPSSRASEDIAVAR
jgi:colanic acid biosynthesis glycosyl transferase WcaI